MKFYSYINLEYIEIAKLIRQNSARKKDMYLPGESIMPIDYNEDDFFFYTISHSKKRIHIRLFRNWRHKTSEPTFYLIPSQQNSIIIGVPYFLNIIFLIIFLVLAFSSPLFIPFPIILGLVLLCQIDSQLDEMLNNLKLAFEKSNLN